MLTYTADVLFDPADEGLRHLPEGPIDLGGGRFSWIGIQHGPDARSGSLNLFDLATRENRSIPLAGRPGFALPAGEPDRFFIGLERRLVLFDVESGTEETLADDIDADVEGTIINDGVACESGLLFGAKELTFTTKTAGLYFWRAADRQLFRLRDDQICSNGKVVRRQNGDVRYLDIDTPTKQVVEYVLDIESGTQSQPRTVLELGELPFFPDGMIGSPDGEGVIISFYNPAEAPCGETRWYDVKTGACRAVWRTPGSPRATCPLLIEQAGKMRLVITTAVEGMPADQRARAPHAGCLFIAETPW